MAGQADLATVLWPGTWGYYLTQMLRLNDADAGTETWRRWAVNTIRPGGPLPTLRLGDQPYGVLPATALRRWRPRGDRGNIVVARLVTAGRARHTDLSVLGQIDSNGTWTFRHTLGQLEAPAGATGVAVAVRHRNGRGRPELVVGYSGSAGPDGTGDGVVVRCDLHVIGPD